jgi:hypothetical protein
MGFMKRKDSIVRDLVRQLETKTMKYSEIQNFAMFHPLRKLTLEQKKKYLLRGTHGWWCANLRNLINNRVIISFKPLGYFSVPGISENKTFFNSKLNFRGISCYLLHPVIKKFIEDNGLEQDYI